MSPAIIIIIVVICFLLSLLAFGVTRQHPSAWTRPLRWGVIAPALLWSVYAVWEWIMRVTFPSRPDGWFIVFVFWPFLGAAALWAIISFSLILDRALHTTHSKDQT